MLCRPYLPGLENRETRGTRQLNRWDVLKLKGIQPVKFGDPLDPSILQAVQAKTRELSWPASRKLRGVQHPKSFVSDGRDEG